jgi:type IV pilus assembly protein PilB
MMSTRMQELIQKRATGSDLRDLAIREGMVPLRKSGWQKVAEGITSIAEVVRVTSNEVDMLNE